jgi:large subunit ribosomal protein L24
VLQVDRDKGKVLVEGISMAKRHTRPNPAKQIKGGIAERESAIAVSNVMIVTSGNQTSRIGYKVEGSGTTERRVRIAKKTGEVLDKKG